MVRSIAVLLVGGLLSALAVPLWAQEAILGQTYGNGVHAYFSGEYVRAHQLLTSLAYHSWLPHDPAPLLLPWPVLPEAGPPARGRDGFPAGSKIGDGRSEQDLQRGQAAGTHPGYAGGAEVERYRIQARMAALDRSEKDRQRRYEETNRLEQKSLKQQAVATPSTTPGTEPIPAAPDAPPPPRRTTNLAFRISLAPSLPLSRRPNRLFKPSCREPPRQSPNPKPTLYGGSVFVARRSLMPLRRSSRQQNRARGLSRPPPLTINMLWRWAEQLPA